jgi:hypothetical protein
MAEQGRPERPGQGARGSQEDAAHGNEEQQELQAEQESAEAMDAEVPQPPGASQTTEGQPS